MNVRQKIAGWYTAEKAKLAPMTFSKRAGYILHYYRNWFLGLVGLIAVLALIGSAVVQSHRTTLLEGFYTNDTWNLFPAQKIEKDYGDSVGLKRSEQIVLDDGLYIDLGGNASDYTAASNGKIIAYMATGELDFVVTTGDVLARYTGEVPMQDLAQILAPDVLAQVRDSLVTGTDADGNTIYVALDMTKSRYVAGVGADQDPAVTDTYYLFVPYRAPHPAQISDYVRYCFSQN